MSDRRWCITACGVVVGVALVGIAAGLFARCRQPKAVEDVNDVIAHAKNTINSLNEAVEIIKSSAVHS